MKYIMTGLTLLAAFSANAVQVNTCQLNTDLHYQVEGQTLTVAHDGTQLVLDAASSRLTDKKSDIKHTEVVQLDASLRAALSDMKQMQLATFKLELLGGTLAKLSHDQPLPKDAQKIIQLLAQTFDGSQQYQRYTGLNVEHAKWQTKSQQLAAQYYASLAGVLESAVASDSDDSSIIELLSERQPPIGERVEQLSASLCENAKNVAQLQQSLKSESWFLSTVELAQIDVKSYAKR